MSQKFEFKKLATINVKPTKPTIIEEVSFSKSSSLVQDDFFKTVKVNSSFINYESENNKIEEILIAFLKDNNYGDVIKVCSFDNSIWNKSLNNFDIITLYRTASSYNPYLKFYGFLAEKFKDRFGVKNDELFLKISNQEYIEVLKNKLINLDTDSIKRSKIVCLLSNIKNSIENRLIKASKKKAEDNFEKMYNKEMNVTHLEFSPQTQFSDFVLDDLDSLGGASFQVSKKYDYIKTQEPKKIASMLSSKNLTYKQASSILSKIGFPDFKKSFILKEFSMINLFKKDIQKRTPR